MRSLLKDGLWAVVLAGGVGSRFWPASTPSHPKQLLRLASDRPLIRDTVERVEPLIPRERIRILTGDRLAPPISRALQGFDSTNFLLEPRAAGTGPVLTWAAYEIERVDPDAIMISLHADHVIHPPERFREQLVAASTVARNTERLFTIGAVPTRPETGYGYIRIGREIEDQPAAEAFEVRSFVEKPDEPTAKSYVAAGDYLWNTGIFVWRVRDLLQQIAEHTPEISEHLHLLKRGDHQEFFNRVPTISIDEGLLERSDRVGVVPAHFGWDDIGSWEAIFRTHELDGARNARIGDTFAHETADSLLYAEDGPIVAFGVDNLVVVRTGGVTFVTTREHAPRLKDLVDALPEELRTLDGLSRDR